MNKIKKDELEAALRIAAAVAKPETSWGNKILLMPQAGLISHGINTRLRIALPKSQVASPMLLEEDVLRGLVGSLDEEISFSVGKTTVELVSGSFRSKLTLFDPSMYPEAPKEERGTWTEFSLEDLQTRVKEVEFAISDDVDHSSKSALTGLILKASEGNLQLIGARDPLVASSKMAGLPKTFAMDCALPREICQLLLRLPGEKLMVRSGDGVLKLKAGDVQVWCSEIRGAAPDFAAVQERSRPAKITVDKLALKKALAQVSVFRDRSSRSLTLHITKTSLKTSIISQSSGKATATIALSSSEGFEEPFAIGADMGYLQAMVDKITADPNLVLQIGESRELIAVEDAIKLYITVTSVPDKDFED
jgi:DNA polymerase III sliding clamp (beta) subunit (PCNA family)